MTIKAFALNFCVGFAIGMIIVAIYSRITDHSWLDGVVVIALSIPITFFYFLVVWGISRWSLFAPTSASITLVGFLCAVYPAASGTFPIYSLRLGLALLLLAVQLTILIVILVVFARLRLR